MLDRIHDGFMAGIAKIKGRSGEDDGDLVQNIIIIAGFAVAAIVIVGAITSTLLNKGEAVADCIAGANSFQSGSIARDECKSADDAAEGASRTAIDGNFGTGA